MIKYGDRISLCMISLNEEGAITKLLNELKNLDQRIQVVLVDSSDDQTAEIAKSFGAKVIKQYPPMGYGLAMDKALRSCDKEVIITMDCDCTYPINKIDEVSRAIIEQNFDIVDCNRLKNKPENMPMINYLGNKAFAFIASLLFFKYLPDLHSGMRGYRKKTLIDEINYDPNGPSLPVDLLILFVKKEFKLKIIDIKYYERIGNSKMLPFETSLWTIKRIIKSRFSS